MTVHAAALVFRRFCENTENRAFACQNSSTSSLKWWRTLLAQVQQWAKWLKAMPGLSAIGKHAEQDSKQSHFEMVCAVIR
jgi:hypothetical protein